MSGTQPPPVVAELGRPETAEETADRKAAASQRHRDGQTPFNLVIALAASLLAVLVVVLIVVRPDPPAREPVPYQSIAAQAGATTALAAPVLPSGWSANAAQYDAAPADGVANWYVGFVTPDHQFLAIRQGINANPTWLANQVANSAATGTRQIDGVTWTVYDRRGTADAGNFAYAMTETGRTNSFVVYGTAPDSEFTVVGTALAQTIQEDR